MSVIRLRIVAVIGGLTWFVGWHQPSARIGLPNPVTHRIEPECAFHVRQGDVFLRAVPGVPPWAEPVDRAGGRIVLAYGVVTGQTHAIRSAEGGPRPRGAVGRPTHLQAAARQPFGR